MLEYQRDRQLRTQDLKAKCLKSAKILGQFVRAM